MGWQSQQKSVVCLGKDCFPLALEFAATPDYSGPMYNGPMQHDEKKRAPSDLLRRLLACFSLDWLALIFDLYGYLTQWLSPGQNGLYEILDYEATLELCDGEGREAHFSKRQKLRFVQDNIIAFQDYVWGNGRISDYRCSRGHIADQYQEGDRWHILLSLRETKNRGDVEEFHIQYTIHDGFGQDEEWWQVEIRNPTRRLQIAIVFPPERRCTRALLLQRSRQRSTRLDASYFSDLPDGRQTLRWETEKIGGFDLYTIRWWW